MKQHLNTLFVTTQGAYLRKDGKAVAVRIEKETRLRVPLHNLDGIVGFGRVSMSPALMGACADAGVSISFLKENGRFRPARGARIETCSAIGVLKPPGRLRPLVVEAKGSKVCQAIKTHAASNIPG